MYWYDGSVKPARELLSAFKLGGASEAKGDDQKSDAKADAKGSRAGTFANSGCIVVGEKGSLYAPGDYAENKISLSPGLEEIEADFVESPGHWPEWVRAIRGGEEAMSNFPHYAVPLTETVRHDLLYYPRIPQTTGRKCLHPVAVQSTRLCSLSMTAPLYSAVYPAVRIVIQSFFFVSV
jgi:hypothetical protein